MSAHNQETFRDLRRAAGLTPGKEKSWKGAPVFIAGALHCKTQHKACKWRLFPLLVSYLASSCQGKVCGEQSRSREGKKLIRFFFWLVFFFYMADAGFPHTPPAPHKLFFPRYTGETKLRCKTPAPMKCGKSPGWLLVTAAIHQTKQHLTFGLGGSQVSL